MNLKLELTEDCPRCDGMGWVYAAGSAYSRDRIDCDRCKGTGNVPTWQGIELLNFIDTYKDWMEDD